MQFKILIFIITYKASFRVLDVVKKIPFSYLKNINYKILISDDFSNDNTVDYIRKLKKKYLNIIYKINNQNVGYGGNIKRCIDYAYKNNYDFAIMLHGDDQYNAKYIKQMIEIFKIDNKSSALIGSRMRKKSSALKGNMPIYKFLGNIFLTKLFNYIYNTNFSDCHSGYWAYDLKKIKKTFFIKSDNHFCFDIDMRLMLIHNKLKIREFDIKTKYGSEKSSMHIIYALRYLFKIIKFKFFKKL